MLDGRYRVDTLIATGGMSWVYRGLDLRLDRPVALKIMDSRYAGDNQFLTRFQREARAVARLKDPGLVAVYDQGIDGQHPFLVMELIEGGTLRELLVERGPMPPHAVAAAKASVLLAEKEVVADLLTEGALFAGTLKEPAARRAMERFLAGGGQTREGELRLGSLIEELGTAR